MGLIDQQGGAMLGAEAGQGTGIRLAAFHAEQAFTDDQQPLAGRLGPGLAEASRQVRQVVVGKALQAGAAGLNPHQ